MRRHDGAPRRERRHGRRWAGGPAGGVPSTAVRDRFEQSSRGLVGSGRQARAMNPEVRRTPVRRKHARASGSTPERHPAPSPRDGLFFFLPARGTTRGMGTRDPREARRAMPAKSTKPPRGAVRFFFFRVASADAPDDTPPKVPRTPTTCGDMGECQMGTRHIRHLRGDTLHDAIAKLRAVQLSDDWERTCVRRVDAGRASRYELRDGMRYRRPTWHELDDRGRTARGPLRPRKAPHAARRRRASPRDAKRKRAAGTRAMRAW